MRKLTVLLVDDERAARQELKRALAAYPQLELVGEAANADDAQQLITARRPDLLLLDIQLPERSGFDLLEALDDVPQVIFVTAYDQYALQAFEFNAFDYLLKPFREERFGKAIDKVLRHWTATGPPVCSPATQRLFVRDGNRCFFVQLREVHLIESLDNYARLHFGTQRVLLRSSLNQLEEKLDPAVFFRANRTQLVNLHFIDQLRRQANGTLQAVLTTGQTLDFSERQSTRFRQQNRL
ncbi:LytR/AlgR family response regulator transcription factor [Hymenobacter negativus]|uniref:Response regulator transcription factor n=1 Tax=Hymenobacter negativus TaxID=2795026 RepID=A0ABS3QLE9_9BACT|nr:LytTR family DNA-binding domain-containing protein [Hymenobacter negativus]MBO2012095.1 response regulator transcription factor [Hymenobacter negativus]